MKLWYYVVNGGDGSAFPRFFGTKEEATKAEQNDIEEYGQAWGEDSVGCVNLTLENGNLYLVDHEWNGSEHKEVKTLIL